MRTSVSYILSLIAILFLSNCSTDKTIPAKYYLHHKTVLDSIEQSYKEIYSRQPFAIGFLDKKLESISVEIVTDTLKHIFSFNVNENKLTDTLRRYKINAEKTLQLIKQMQAIRCVWVNNVDYYEANKKHLLTFISIKSLGFTLPLSSRKYYVLIYFPDAPTYRKRRLLDNKKFKRVNNKIAYTISSDFR